jgi:AP-1 complex subunit beta-1
MTVGKDVTPLFPDVTNCSQTDDLELKKLVYLFMINTAKSAPELCLMTVNSFVKDTQDPNPLIRALAVRTMGCIRVDKITEYLLDPLQRALKDEDPYVRKTAAVCVAKLHDINPELVEDHGFLESLQALLRDANPMVVANAVAALQEIQEVSGRPVFKITPDTFSQLLPALNECTEWGQVFILDSLATYTPTDPKEAELLVERVTPRLQHANAAVVLAAVKVILKNMTYMDPAAVAPLQRKLAGPLVTLLSAEPEIQYVALRCISLIVQKYPGILSHEVKVFFCKYNDPIYVKTEKLEIMIRLASEKNIDQILLEFKEYATEVDVDFVRRAVRAIGRCAVSLEQAAEKCINVLLDLIAGRVGYVVQECIVVIRDIFRRYPNRYERIIATLCENLDSLDEPEAKGAMVWIIGEYAERIDNADELLEQFLDTFPEEPASVQLQLVTAAVKLFLKKPTERPQQLIQLVLTYATQETDNPDLRDRAYIYWRLLSTDPEAAKEIVLVEKPVISDTQDSLEPSLLDNLLGELGSLASVYHKPASSFVSRARVAVQTAEELAAMRSAAAAAEEVAEGDQDMSSAEVAGSQPGTARSSQQQHAAAVPDLLGDLLDLEEPATVAAGGTAAPIVDLLGGLDMGGVGVSSTPASPAAGPLSDDFFGLGGSGGAPPAAAVSQQSTLPVLADTTKGKGLAIRGRVERTPSGSIVYKLSLENISTNASLSGFMIQINKNALGLTPANQNIQITTLAPGTVSGEIAVPLIQDATKVSAPPANDLLQVAIKCSPLGVVYFTDNFPLECSLVEDGIIEGSDFIARYKATPETQEAQAALPVSIGDGDRAANALQAVRLFVLARRGNQQEEVMYVTGRVGMPPGGVEAVQLLLELRFMPGAPGVRAFCRCARPDLAPLAFDVIKRALGM